MTGTGAHKGGWKICMISLFLTHKVFRAADGCFSTLGMTNICQLLSIRSAAPSLASLAPLCPSEITEGGLQLIARIIKFNIYLNKYNQPAV